MAQPSQTAKPMGAPGAPATPRRGFLAKAAAIAVGGICLLVPAASGLAVFLDPLRKRTKSDQFVGVAPLDALPDDGVPRQFPVVAERVDAWNRSKEPIGAVYLRRAKGEQSLQCWTATCPHAGCFVAFDDSTNTFKCPCHNSAFTVDGQMIEPSPSPRAMDSLECKIDGDEVLVKFESFYTGTSEKVAKT